MTLLQIKYFLTAARHGNITRAAEALYVAQPAMTKQIMALENELGMALFYRHARSVELTPAGEIMARGFLEMSDIFEDAKRKAALTQNDRCDHLSIGMLEGMYLERLSAAIKIFKEKHVNVNLNYWRGQYEFLKSEFLDDHVDIIFTFDNQLINLSNYETATLFTSEYKILLPKNHPLAGNDFLDKDKIADEHFILAIKDSGKTGNNHLKAACSALRIKKENIIPSPTFSSMFSMVECGAGIALIDMMVDIPNRDAYAVFPTGIFHEFVAVWKKNSPNTLIQEFLKSLDPFNI